MKPLTTFIIPTVGRETLQRAIDSAERQAPVLFEKDTGHAGPSVIRNRLIRQAKTEWVSFLDDDDTVTDDYVQRLKEEIEKNPDVDVVIFKEYFLWGQIIPQWPTTRFGEIGIAFSLRREVALEFPFRTEKHEDYELIRRLESAGKKIVFSNYLVYRGRH